MSQMEHMKILIARLASSDHQIFKSLIYSYIEPLLSDLYPMKSSDGQYMLDFVFVMLIFGLFSAYFHSFSFEFFRKLAKYWKFISPDWVPAL